MRELTQSELDLISGGNDGGEDILVTGVILPPFVYPSPGGFTPAPPPPPPPGGGTNPVDVAAALSGILKEWEGQIASLVNDELKDSFDATVNSGATVLKEGSGAGYSYRTYSNGVTYVYNSSNGSALGDGEPDAAIRNITQNGYDFSVNGNSWQTRPR